MRTDPTLSNSQGVPLQFTLRQVGIAALVLCVFLALVAQWGIWAVPGFIAVVIVVCLAH